MRRHRRIADLDYITLCAGLVKHSDDLRCDGMYSYITNGTPNLTQMVMGIPIPLN
jgi:hypothetical protein